MSQPTGQLISQPTGQLISQLVNQSVSERCCYWKLQEVSVTHTHTHTHTHARTLTQARKHTHTHSRTQTHTHARTHARRETGGQQTNPTRHSFHSWDRLMTLSDRGSYASHTVPLSASPVWPARRPPPPPPPHHSPPPTRATCPLSQTSLLPLLTRAPAVALCQVTNNSSGSTPSARIHPVAAYPSHSQTATTWGLCSPLTQPDRYNVRSVFTINTARPLQREVCVHH